LRLRGIDLAAHTWFQAASHSLSPARFEFIDREEAPLRHSDALNDVESSLRAVEAPSGHKGYPSGLVRWPLAAKLFERAASVFEQPAEIAALARHMSGHAGCALCLLGLKVDSASLPSSGAFMASYDASSDSDGRRLASLLEAVVPACAKVNLDYFFARIDSDQYAVGARYASSDMQDPGGDVRAGLPSAAVESFEPFRLLVVAYAPPEIFQKALLASPRTLELATKNWVLLASVAEGKTYSFRASDAESGGAFQGGNRLAEMPRVDEKTALIGGGLSDFGPSWLAI
jgi:hypothetical protein